MVLAQPDEAIPVEDGVLRAADLGAFIAAARRAAPPPFARRAAYLAGQA